MFCKCCGMRLRANPHRGRVYKEKVNQLFIGNKGAQVYNMILDSGLLINNMEEKGSFLLLKISEKH
jgi:hypothetical protein